MQVAATYEDEIASSLDLDTYERNSDLIFSGFVGISRSIKRRM